MSVELNNLFEFELPVSITIRTGKAMKISKDEYKERFGALCDCINSVKSAREHEQQAEALRLQFWIDELEGAEMKRKDQRLIEAAVRKIREARNIQNILKG